MREIKKGMDSMKEANPNMAEIAAKQVFKSFQPAHGVRSAAALRAHRQRRRLASRP